MGMKKGTEVCVDPRDRAGMARIMDQYGDCKDMCVGVNEKEEKCFVFIFSDKIVVRTFQENGWERVDTYYRNGDAETIFDGKWKN